MQCNGAVDYRLHCSWKHLSHWNVMVPWKRGDWGLLPQRGIGTRLGAAGTGDLQKRGLICGGEGERRDSRGAKHIMQHRQRQWPPKRTFGGVIPCSNRTDACTDVCAGALRSRYRCGGGYMCIR